MRTRFSRSKLLYLLVLLILVPLWGAFIFFLHGMVAYLIFSIFPIISPYQRSLIVFWFTIVGFIIGLIEGVRRAWAVLRSP